MESKSFQKRPAKDDVMRIERVELALHKLPTEVEKTIEI
jgi:hypothetical protein